VYNAGCLEEILAQETRRCDDLDTINLVVAMMFCATAGFAQDGKLKIKVIPKHAYVLWT